MSRTVGGRSASSALYSLPLKIIRSADSSESVSTFRAAFVSSTLAPSANAYEIGKRLCARLNGMSEPVGFPYASFITAMIRPGPGFLRAQPYSIKTFGFDTSLSFSR